jgi:hypothetical protein
LNSETGYGGGIFLTTNPPKNIGDVGKIYVKHCFFQNNYAVYGNEEGGIGRGIVVFSDFLFLIDIGFYDNGVDILWTFIDHNNNNHLTYFSHSLSRTKFQLVSTRHPRLFFIKGYEIVYFILYEKIKFFL